MVKKKQLEDFNSIKNGTLSIQSIYCFSILELFYIHRNQLQNNKEAIISFRVTIILDFLKTKNFWLHPPETTFILHSKDQD